jgi:hypothetical protein
MERDAQLAELEARHRDLDQAIEDALAHPGSDDLKIAEMKREKLRLKEEINRATADGVVAA